MHQSFLSIYFAHFLSLLPPGCKNIMQGTVLSCIFGTCLMSSRSYSNLKTHSGRILYSGGEFSELVSKGRRSSCCKVKSEGKLENKLQSLTFSMRIINRCKRFTKHLVKSRQGVVLKFACWFNHKITSIKMGIIE